LFGADERPAAAATAQRPRNMKVIVGLVAFDPMRAMRAFNIFTFSSCT
jgi:hypothetical protein